MAIKVGGEIKNQPFLGGAEWAFGFAKVERVCRIDPDGDGVVPGPKIMAVLFIPILPGTHGNELGQVVA